MIRDNLLPFHSLQLKLEHPHYDDDFPGGRVWLTLEMIASGLHYTYGDPAMRGRV